MSEMDKETVKKVALLARIAFSEEELAQLTQELKSIVDWVDAIQDLNVTDVEPMTHVLGKASGFREDLARPSLPQGFWLEQAPSRAEDAFEVPRVVE